MPKLTDRQNATYTAYSRLRADILNGTLPAGHRLTETAQAERLELSRTPVREAIGRLISEGFVERGEGYSTRVAEFAPEELLYVFEIRARIEAYAARQAALNCTPEDIARLRALADVMSARTPARSNADFDAIAQANEAFHRLLYNAAKSPRLQVIIAAVVDVGVVAWTYRSYSDRAMIRSAQHHEELVDAIEAREPDWAENVMRAHVLAAKACIVGLSVRDAAE